MTLDEIKAKYGVTQSDAAVGRFANEAMAISQACQAAKKELQKAAKYTNAPILKILQPKLQAAFNAIDAVSGGATAINHGKYKGF